MNEREKFLLRMALSYLMSNVDDANDAFDYDGPDSRGDCIIVGGEIDLDTNEEELQALADKIEAN